MQEIGSAACARGRYNSLDDRSTRSELHTQTHARVCNVYVANVYIICEQCRMGRTSLMCIRCDGTKHRVMNLDFIDKHFTRTWPAQAGRDGGLFRGKFIKAH